MNGFLDMPRLPTPAEFEERFSEFVRIEDGERVDEVLPPAPNSPPLADYLLWNRSVIAEMKCITADHFQSPVMGERLTKLLRHGLQTGAIGRSQLRGKTFSVDDSVDIKLRQEMLDELARPLGRVATHASKQIRSTATMLSIVPVRGLLILVNLADRRLTPPLLQALLPRMLRSHTNTLHFVAFYSPHLGMRLPDGRRPTLVMTGMNGSQPQEEMRRVSALMRGWLKFNEGRYLDA